MKDPLTELAELTQGMRFLHDDLDREIVDQAIPRNFRINSKQQLVPIKVSPGASHTPTATETYDHRRSPSRRRPSLHHSMALASLTSRPLSMPVRLV